MTRILRFSLNLAGGILQSTDFKRRQFILSNMNDDDGNTKQQVITIENLPIIQDELNIQYLRQMQSKVSTHSEWYVGGILKEYFSLSMGAIVFVHSEVSLNPSVFYCFTLNEKSNIFSSLSLPVIGIITRLPYSNDPADGKNGPFVSSYTLGTKFATLNKYQRVNFDLAYKYILNNKWSIAANYRFYWFHYSVNRGITAYDNAFHLQFDRKLQLRQKKNSEGSVNEN
jgi:hypothetical protein